MPWFTSKNHQRNTKYIILNKKLIRKIASELKFSKSEIHKTFKQYEIKLKKLGENPKIVSKNLRNK